MNRIASSIAMAACFLTGTPAIAQIQREIYIPRTVILPPPDTAQSSTAPVETPSREEGAALPQDYSSTFDIYSQMVKRFNALDKRIDQLSQQNAALSKQLDDLRETQIAQARTAGRTPKGYTIGAAIELTCGMVAELLYIEKDSFLGFNPPEGGGNRPC